MKKETKSKGKNEMNREKVSWMTGKTLNVLKSFKVKELMIDVDTGDYILNAYLHPVFYFLSGGNRFLQVNYAGRNNTRIIVQNRLVSILYSFIN